MQGGPLKPCPVCQQRDGSRPEAGLLEPSRGQMRRSNRSRRKPLSEEHKEKIRAALAGRKRKPLDEEHKRCAVLPCQRLVCDACQPRCQLCSGLKGQRGPLSCRLLLIGSGTLQPLQVRSSR